MDKKLLINVVLSLIGILIYYLIRRVEINREFNQKFIMYLKKSIIIQKRIDEKISRIAIEISTYIYTIINFSHVFKKIYKKFGSYHKSQIKSSSPIFINLMGKEMPVFLYKQKKEDKKSYNSVSDILIGKKSKKNDNVMKLMFVFVMINCFFSFINVNIRDIVYLVLTVQIWLVLINQILLNYRNKKGYYGTNYDEAKEIIYFIKKSSNDDINKFGGKKILNEVEEQVSVTGVQKVIV